MPASVTRGLASRNCSELPQAAIRASPSSVISVFERLMPPQPVLQVIELRQLVVAHQGWSRRITSRCRHALRPLARQTSARTRVHGFGRHRRRRAAEAAHEQEPAAATVAAKMGSSNSAVLNRHRVGLSYGNSDRTSHSASRRAARGRSVIMLPQRGQYSAGTAGLAPIARRTGTRRTARHRETLRAARGDRLPAALALAGHAPGFVVVVIRVRWPTGPRPALGASEPHGRRAKQLAQQFRIRSIPSRRTMPRRRNHSSHLRRAAQDCQSTLCAGKLASESLMAGLRIRSRLSSWHRRQRPLLPRWRVGGRSGTIILLATSQPASHAIAASGDYPAESSAMSIPRRRPFWTRPWRWPAARPWPRHTRGRERRYLLARQNAAHPVRRQRRNVVDASCRSSSG